MTNPRFFILLLVGIILCFLLFSFDTISGAAEGSIYIIRIEDKTINPVTASYVIKSIKTAYNEAAECLIIELDTPGGLLTSTRSIIKEIMSSKVPIIVYVYPSGSRAGSAGVFITYASHFAAMAPSTNIGAASPVEIGRERKGIWDSLRELLKGFLKKSQEKKDTHKEEEREPDVLSDKILQDTKAFIRSLAQQRGRCVWWAEKSVTESASITEKEALKIGVIEIIAKDEKDLLEQLDGKVIRVGLMNKKLKTKGANIKYIPMDFRMRFLNILANPNVAYILLLLGFYGLLFEVTHPGVGFPGIAGFICLILAFFSMQILPTNYAGLALIILAIILFIAETQVPGFGLLTLGGLICMILGSLLLFRSPYKIMRISVALIFSFTITTALITLFLLSAVIRSHRKKVLSGQEALIGKTGKVKTSIAKGKIGKVFIHGEIWDALSDEDIQGGENIEVVGIKGMVLIVKKLIKD